MFKALILGALVWVARGPTPRFVGSTDGERWLRNLSLEGVAVCGIGREMGERMTLTPRSGAWWPDVGERLDIWCTTDGADVALGWVDPPRTF